MDELGKLKDIWSHQYQMKLNNHFITKLSYGKTYGEHLGNN